VYVVPAAGAADHHDRRSAGEGDGRPGFDNGRVRSIWIAWGDTRGDAQALLEVDDI
jgi:hypothetical protein